MTYEQIFSGRMRLSSAMRHIAQQHGCYPEGELHFRTAEGFESFAIVKNCLAELEQEFKAMSARRNMRSAGGPNRRAIR